MKYPLLLILSMLASHSLFAENNLEINEETKLIEALKKRRELELKNEALVKKQVKTLKLRQDLQPIEKVNQIFDEEMKNL